MQNKCFSIPSFLQLLLQDVRFFLSHHFLIGTFVGNNYTQKFVKIKYWQQGSTTLGCNLPRSKGLAHGDKSSKITIPGWVGGPLLVPLVLCDHQIQYGTLAYLETDLDHCRSVPCDLVSPKDPLQVSSDPLITYGCDSLPPKFCSLSASCVYLQELIINGIIFITAINSFECS